MSVASGGRFYPLDPRPDEVRIYDIAAGLSKCCRFAGQGKFFYSVAQHSVHVARLLFQKEGELSALVGLLHDAAEAYIGDMVRPLKRSMPQFRKVEDRIMRAVWKRFGLTKTVKLGVQMLRHYDDQMIWNEANLLLGEGVVKTWPWRAERLAFDLVPWTETYARHAFLDTYEDLRIRLPFHTSLPMEAVKP